MSDFYLEKDSLVAALDFCKCKELPEELKEGDIFVRALIKVQKGNNRHGFCLAVNDGTGKPCIKKTFGSVAQIVKILSIYPLSILDRNYFPVFNKKEEIVMHLVKYGENRDYIERLCSSGLQEDKDKIKSLITRYSIEDQFAEEVRASVCVEREKRAEAAARQLAEEQAKHAEDVLKKENEIKERAKHEEFKRTKRQKTERKTRTKA